MESPTPPTLDKLIERLQDPSAEVRYQAALSLSWVKPSPVQAVDHLLAMLSDEGYIIEDVGDSYSGAWEEHRFVADRAASALERMPTEAREGLQRVLREGRPNARVRAAQLLGLQRDYPTLFEALTDPRAEVRLAVVQALDKAIDGDTLPSTDRVANLYPSLGDVSHEVISATVTLLKKVKQRGVPVEVDAQIHAVTQRLKSKQKEDRAAACEAIGLMTGDIAAASLLVEVLRVDDPFVCRFAAISLNEVDSWIEPSACLTMVYDRSLHHGQASRPSRVTSLLSRLSEPLMSWVRPPMMLALVKHGVDSAAAVAAFLPFALHSRVVEIPVLYDDERSAAVVAIARLGGAVRGHLPEIERQLDSDDAAEVERARRLLSVVHGVDDEAVRILEARLRNDLTRNGDAARVASWIEALTNFAPTAVRLLPTLIPLLDGEQNWRVVNAAAKVVCLMGSHASPAMKALRCLLSDPRHRQLTLYAVDSLGPHAAPLRETLRALQSAVPTLAQQAQRTLDAIG